MSDSLTFAAEAIDELDFSAAAERVAVLQADCAPISDAIERAEARLAEIGELLTADNRARQAHSMADALLDGTAPDEAFRAAPERERLMEERGAMLKTKAQLEERLEIKRQAITTVQREALNQVAPAVRPLIDAAMADAHAAVATLSRSFATLSAITWATRMGSRETEQVGQALAAVAAAQGPFTIGGSVTIPGEVRHVLGSLVPHVPAVPAPMLPERIAVPAFLRLTANLAGLAAAVRAGQ